MNPWILPAFLLILLLSSPLPCRSADNNEEKPLAEKPEPEQSANGMERESILLDPELEAIIMAPLKLRASEYTKALVRLQLEEVALPLGQDEDDFEKSYTLKLQIKRLELGLKLVALAVAQRIFLRHELKGITKNERTRYEQELGQLQDDVTRADVELASLNEAYKKWKAAKGATAQEGKSG